MTARTFRILAMATFAVLADTTTRLGLAQTHNINVTGGQLINENLRGQSVPNLDVNNVLNPNTLDLTTGSSIRGPAPGLFAETYDWKNRTGYGVGEPGNPGPPTLEYLRYARDYDADLFMTVNTRGTGTGYSSSDFVWTNTTAAPLPSMAADWVRYTNFIAPNYKQGDVLSASDQAIVNSLQWGSHNRLRGASEAPTNKVAYWEIGNEPEIGFTDASGFVYTLSPTEFANRYVAITQAMRAVDPTIKVGPVMGRGVLNEDMPYGSAGSMNPYLLAVLDHPDAQIDFISYHPYTALFTEYINGGSVPTLPVLEDRLRYIRPKQVSEYQLIRNEIQENNDNNFFGILGPIRNLNTPVVASEWNPGSYQAGGMYVGRTMAQALASAETVFNFAQNENMIAAQYWVWPVWLTNGKELPVTKAFQGLRDHMGDTLVDVLATDDTSNIRLYTTKNSSTGEIVVWGLNFSDDVSQTLQLSLDNLAPGQDYTVTLMRLASLVGDTSLMSYTSDQLNVPLTIDWTSTNLTGSIDLSNFSLTLDDATLTALVIQPVPEPMSTMVVLISCCGLMFKRNRNTHFSHSH